MSSEFHAVQGRPPTTPKLLKSITFLLGFTILGKFMNEWCVGSLNYSFEFDWGMDVGNGLRVEKK